MTKDKEKLRKLELPKIERMRKMKEKKETVFSDVKKSLKKRKGA